MVERQIQQLTRLVDDLVDVSRVGHGKINLQIKTVDLKPVVALAVEISRPLIDSRKHVLTVSLPRHAVEVEGDPGRLAQVVSNLLNNSAKYSEDGGRIELTLEAIGDRGRSERARQRASGSNRPMLPRIFDLFLQVNASASRSRSRAWNWPGPGAQRGRVARWLGASRERGPGTRNRVRRPSAALEEDARWDIPPPRTRPGQP